MNKISTAILFVILNNFCFAQGGYFSYKTITQDQNLRFPVFKRSANDLTTEKINQHLQLSELELLYGHQKKNIFEAVSIDQGSLYGGKTDLNFEIINNSEKLLTIRFDEASCGMTCFYWTRYYNFNPGNGDLLLLSDLFTTKGFDNFKKHANKRRLENFKSQLDDSTEVKAGEETKKEWIDQVKDCFENDDFLDYYIKNDSIVLDNYNCLSKNEKFLGDLLINKIALSEFKNYLNDYGKTLFSISKGNIAGFHSKGLPQLFKGTIGTYPILLLLRLSNETNVEGIYVYIKEGKGINLQGSFVNNYFDLMEEKNSGDISYLSGDFDGKTIIGNWTNNDKTKALKLQLQRK